MDILAIAQTEMEDLEVALAKANADNEALRQELANINSSYEQLSEQNRRLSEQVEVMNSTISSLNDNISALTQRFIEADAGPVKRKIANVTKTKPTLLKRTTHARPLVEVGLPVLNIGGNTKHNFAEVAQNGQRYPPSGVVNVNEMDTTDVSAETNSPNISHHLSAENYPDHGEDDTSIVSINTNGWSPVKSRAQIRDEKKNAANADNNVKSSRVTPLQLQELDSMQIGHISGLLSNEIGPNEFHIQRLSGNRATRIYCSSHDAKAKVVQQLRDANIQFNSFNNAETRKKAFIIKGLCYENNIDAFNAVAQALAALKINGDVTEFETPYLRYHPSNKRTPMFRLVVENSVPDSTILEIRTIGFFGVRIEKMKKSSTIQCRKCQRYNHTTGQCNFEYRCVQCIENHQPGSCPRAENRAIPIGCINCHDNKLNHLEHTANDLKNCLYFQKIDESKSSKGTKRQTSSVGGTVKGRAEPRSGLKSGVSFAKVVGGQQQQQATKRDRFSEEAIARIVAITVKSVLAALNDHE